MIMTYHNVSAEIPVPSTPFTLYGGVGWTDSHLDEMEQVMALLIT